MWFLDNTSTDIKIFCADVIYFRLYRGTKNATEEFNITLHKEGQRVTYSAQKILYSLGRVEDIVRTHESTEHPKGTKDPNLARAIHRCIQRADNLGKRLSQVEIHKRETGGRIAGGHEKEKFRTQRQEVVLQHMFLHFGTALGSRHHQQSRPDEQEGWRSFF